eukprot:6198204-Pleurochrysis_carterae.AAC.1
MAFCRRYPAARRAPVPPGAKTTRRPAFERVCRTLLQWHGRYACSPALACSKQSPRASNGPPRNIRVLHLISNVHPSQINLDLQVTCVLLPLAAALILHVTTCVLTCAFTHIHSTIPNFITCVRSARSLLPRSTWKWTNPFSQRSFTASTEAERVGLLNI